MYRYQRHVYDVTRKFYLLGRDAMVRDLAIGQGDSVIEVGCGTGRNLIRIARAYPHARLYGIDISDAMLATAHQSIARAGLSERITVAQGDATAFDALALFGRSAFDRVVMSYTLSMIPDWAAALDQGARVIAPNGRLHCVDFGDQHGLPRPVRSALTAWLARFDVTPRVDLPLALARTAMAAGGVASSRALYRGYAVAGRIARG